MDPKEKLAKLLMQRSQIDAKVANARVLATTQERRDETRRKIIAGAWMFKAHGHDWQKVGQKLREAGMLEAKDESLFGFNDRQST